MKHTIILLVLVCSFGSLRAQQYHINTYYDTSIVGDSLNKADCDLLLVGGSIALDPSLYNYITGLRFVVVFDSITGTVNNSVGGQIYAGDTFQLNSTRSALSYILTSSIAICSYHVQVIGTPAVLNQAYPCKLQFDACTCFCPRNIIIAADTTAGICHTAAGSGVSELSVTNQIALYPNPASNQLIIETNGEAITEINIYNTTGTLVRSGSAIHGSLQTSIDISPLIQGVYVTEIRIGGAIVKRRLVKM